MIPKLIHLLWINRNGDPIPEKCRPFVSKWQQLHPEYTVKVWGLEEVRSLVDNMFEKFWADVEIDEAAICNLLRMVIVYKFGGIYADVDTEPLKPFDPFLHCTGLGVGLTGVNNKFEMNLFFAEPGNEALKCGIDYYKKADQTLYRFSRIPPLVMSTMDKFCSGFIVKYPKEYFQDRKITSNTYSTHWPHSLGTWRIFIKKQLNARREESKRLKQSTTIDSNFK